ncbi:MAG: hypothetical protein JW900_08590 [Anaerolineae bacterium]|nr:hypothetical protein [Anaerolineae bacterium]
MLNTLLNIYNQHTTKIIFGSGLVLGLLIGLFFAWVIWPTSFNNATTESLRPGDIRDEVLVLIARDYRETGNLTQAQLRLGAEDWKREEPATVLRQLAQDRGGPDAVALNALADALEAPPPEVPTAVTTPAGGEEARTSWTRPVFQICGAGLILAAVGGGAYLLISRLRAGPREISERAIASQAVVGEIAWDETAAPVAQFRSTYTLGDDFYDPSFSIEKANGDFMGECGVGISETIGVGDPKKVTAIEVWLFDKNDIRTITKVLLSEFALQDEALRAKLAAKGEPVQIRPGAEVILDTATLILRVRVTDLEYGQGQLPPNSFFQRVGMEIGIWDKPNAEVPTLDYSDPSILNN